MARREGEGGKGGRGQGEERKGQREGGGRGKRIGGGGSKSLLMVLEQTLEQVVQDQGQVRGV